MESKNTYAKNSVEALERVRKRKYVYLCDRRYIEYIAGQKPCDLTTRKYTLIFDSRVPHCNHVGGLN